MQSSNCNIEIYCTIVSVVKYMEIFQVYNNKQHDAFQRWITAKLAVSRVLFVPNTMLKTAQYMSWTGSITRIYLVLFEFPACESRHGNQDDPAVAGAGLLPRGACVQGSPVRHVGGWRSVGACVCLQFRLQYISFLTAVNVRPAQQLKPQLGACFVSTFHL